MDDTIFFNNQLYHTPDTHFLIQNEPLKKESYLIHKFYENYHEMSGRQKPALSIKEIFDKYPNISLAQLVFFNITNDKNTVFQELLPHLTKAQTLPANISNLLASYGFSEKEVLEQLQKAYGLSFDQLEYRDAFFTYYYYRNHRQDIPWLLNIIKVLLKSKKSTVLEHYFEINGICLFSETNINEAELNKMVNTFPNLETLEHNLLCLALIRRYKLIGENILNKLFKFYDELDGPNHIQELKYYLDLAYNRHIIENFPQKLISKYLNKYKVDYFGLTPLSKITTVNDKLYKKFIAPLARNDFYLYTQFYDREELIKNTPIGEYVAAGIYGLNQDNWEHSYLFADFLAKPELKIKFDHHLFFENIVKQNFINGSDQVKCRLLPLIEKFRPEGSKLHLEIFKIDYNKLPDPEQYIVFDCLNRSKVDQELCGKEALKLLHIMIARSDSCSDKNAKTHNYDNIHLSAFGSNLCQYAFSDKKDLKLFFEQNTNFVVKKSSLYDFRHLFSGLKSYYSFLKNYLDHKSLCQHFSSLFIYKNYFTKIQFERIKEISDLYDVGFEHEESFYKSLANKIDDPHRWEELFITAPHIQEYFKINSVFLKKLSQICIKKG